jgi:hypothetical protein
MPILSSVDGERGEVSGVAVGPVTYADVQNHLLLERHLQGLSYRELLDARGASLALNPAEIRQLADLLRGLSGDGKLGRTAVLVSTEPAFELVRMLEMLVEDVCEIRPFRDEQEARAWLAMESSSAASP